MFCQHVKGVSGFYRVNNTAATAAVLMFYRHSHVSWDAHLLSNLKIIWIHTRICIQDIL